MLCLSCLARRLGRPLRSEDFSSAPVNNHIAQILAKQPGSEGLRGPAEEAALNDQDDRPMDLDDYGLIDNLTVDALGRIDAALLSLATAKTRRVASIVGRTIMHSPAHVPGLPDLLYLERVRLLVTSGALKLEGDMDDLIKCNVCLP
jgi:Protein of unknown function